VLPFNCTANAPGGTELPAVTDRQLGLAIGQIVVQQRITIITLFDPVDPEAPQGEREDPDAPVRHDDRSELLAEPHADQVGMGGVERFAL